jgi:putative effector of murein hydrolase LrgA (UPF0299 family)
MVDLRVAVAVAHATDATRLDRRPAQRKRPPKEPAARVGDDRPCRPILYAVAALFTFQLLGEKALVRILGRPLPGALTGTLLLLGTMLHWVAWRVARGGWPAAAHDAALHPAIVGVMLHFERIAREWLPSLFVPCVQWLRAS